MKRKLIYGTALALICFAYYCSIQNNRTIEKKSEPKYSFGISEFEDIYEDTIDLRLYTSHGRLKQKQNDNEE
jgi:hypothetical protein